MVRAQEGDGEGTKGLVEAGEESIKQAMIGNQIHPFEAARMSNLIAGRAVLIPPSPAALQFWSSLVSVNGFAFKPTLVPAADNGTVELTDTRCACCFLLTITQRQSMMPLRHGTTHQFR